MEGRADGRTDGRTDRQTDKQSDYYRAPAPSMLGNALPWSLQLFIMSEYWLEAEKGFNILVRIVPQDCRHLQALFLNFNSIF